MLRDHLYKTKTKNVSVAHQNGRLFFNNVATIHFQSAHLEGLNPVPSAKRLVRGGP